MTILRPWIRLDREFHEDDKIVAVTRELEAFYIQLICYCSRRLTDGRIPANIPEFLIRHKGGDPQAFMAGLVAQRLVVVTDDGWAIPQSTFSKWQTTTESLVARQFRAGAGGRAKADGRTKNGSMTERTPVASSMSPTVPQVPETSSDSEIDTEAAFIEAWGLYPRRAGDMREMSFAAYARAVTTEEAQRDVLTAIQGFIVTIGKRSAEARVAIPFFSNWLEGDRPWRGYIEYAPPPPRELDHTMSKYGIDIAPLPDDVLISMGVTPRGK